MSTSLHSLVAGRGRLFVVAVARVADSEALHTLRGTGMKVRLYIWIMWLYMLSQYLFVRHVAGEVHRADPACFDFRTSNGKFRMDGKLPSGMETSLAMSRMIFDGDLPDAGYPVALRKKIDAARAALFGTVVLAMVPACFWRFRAGVTRTASSPSCRHPR
ncbi:MAG TPA: hypothetical protein VGC19_15100 [Rhodanobacter sp.]